MPSVYAYLKINDWRKRAGFNSLIGKHWSHRPSKTIISIQNPNPSHDSLSHKEDRALPSRASVPLPVRASLLPTGHAEPAHKRHKRHKRSGAVPPVLGAAPALFLAGCRADSAQANPGAASASRLRLFLSQSAASMQIARRHLPAGRGGLPAPRCGPAGGLKRAPWGGCGLPGPTLETGLQWVEFVRHTLPSCARGFLPAVKRRWLWEFCSDSCVFLCTKQAFSNVKSASPFCF